MSELVDWEPDYNYETTKCNKTPEECSKVFAEQVKHLTVGDAIKLNKKERSKMRKVDWDKTIICGVSLGFMASTLYLLLVIAAQITA